MAIPTVGGIGTGHASDCAWPTHIADDWGFLFVQHGGGTVATPTSCAVIPGFPVTHSGGLLSGFKIKATGAAMANLALASGTDHMWGVIITARGADLTDPIHVMAGLKQMGGVTTGHAPAIETEEADCLLLMILGWMADNAGPIASSWACASLASVTEQYDAGTTTGSGGGLTIASGTLATAGGTVIPTVTLITTAFCSATLAIRPPQVASGLVPPSIGSPYIR